MKYRINRRTGDKISEIGMGTAYVVEAEHLEAVRTVRRAYEGGINYFDLAAADGTARGTKRGRDRIFVEVLRTAGRSAGLQCYRIFCTTGGERKVRILQSLPTLSGRD